MNENNPAPTTATLILLLFRPLFLMGGLILYLLGAGMARYLGAGLNPGAFWLGIGWIITMQIALILLNEYFDASRPQETLSWMRFTGSSGAVGGDKIPRRVVLSLAYAFLAINASVTVILIASVQPEPLVYLFMGIALALGIFYAVPPFRLDISGYGEIIASFIAAFLIPVFAFSLQSKDLTQMIPMVTTPLFFVCLAMFIGLEMPDYYTDLKAGNLNVMIRMGWRNAMNLHNILLLVAYLLLGLALFFGLPRFVVLAALLSLPVALFEIWQVWQISQGGKPNWRALVINAVATFGAMAYLIAYSYWTH